MVCQLWEFPRRLVGTLDRADWVDSRLAISCINMLVLCAFMLCNHVTLLSPIVVAIIQMASTGYWKSTCTQLESMETCIDVAKWPFSFLFHFVRIHLLIWWKQEYKYATELVRFKINKNSRKRAVLLEDELTGTYTMPIDSPNSDSRNDEIIGHRMV